jgi:SAM-dependent methyltransferase
MKSIALAHIPTKGALPRFSETKLHLNTVRFSSLPEFLAWKEDNSAWVADCVPEDHAALVPGETSFAVPGYCAICGGTAEFVVTSDYGRLNSSGELTPNWREHMLCPGCHLSNRQRAALHVAIQDFNMAPGSQIYITEQFGPLYRWLRGHFRNVQGSEYLFPGKPSGTRRFGINHQDVQALSLPSASLDFLLSFEVLEHVPEPDAAFESFETVLRPGGRMIMTVPFTLDNYETTVRAVMHSDGSIEHLMPIELHGDPTDPNGSLCFRHFGWDTLERLNAAGFTAAEVCVYHDRELGYLGGLQMLISAVKA